MFSSFKNTTSNRATGAASDIGVMSDIPNMAVKELKNLKYKFIYKNINIKYKYKRWPSCLDV